MTLGEQLLNLTIEYTQAQQNRQDSYGLDGNPAGREPEEIAAEYERTLRSFLSAP